MPGPMFNPGMGTRCGMMKSPEQIQQEINQLMQQYNSMYQSMSNRVPMNEPAQIVNDTFANRRRGEYSEVHDPSEVEQASVPMDGTPRLFFDFKNKRFWAKKYENGQTYITPYSFGSLMQNSSDAVSFTPSSESSVDYTKELSTQNEPKEESSDARLDRLEAMMGQILERMTLNESNGSGETCERGKQSATSARNGTKRSGKEISGDSSNVVNDDQAG